MRRNQSATSTVNIAAVANVNDKDEQFVAVNPVKDPVTPHPVGINSSKLSFQWLSLVRVVFQVVKSTGEALVKFRFPMGDLFEDFLGAVGKFELKALQGNA